MLFNSYEFILLFLPLVICGYYLLNRMKWYAVSKGFVLLASLFFYGYFNWKYLYLIISSVLFNYTLSRLMIHTGKRAKENQTAMMLRHANRVLISLGVLANLGAIAYYKYFAFFAENINAVFGTSLLVSKLLLPLGISFFTFQQLSYLLDSYQGKVPDYSFLDYALFVTYFPQLIAGPIVLHNELVPQFADPKKKQFDSHNFSTGLYAFAFGLAKKVLIADNFGKIADWGFSNIEALGSTNGWAVMLAYTFQIYFDFSGYCDMASGIGKMMNIDLPMNFNSPYKALTIEEFWKRWHITLTRFFKAYVYIPMGGNKKGPVRTSINLLAVFLISGLWHGANWTFIVWGALHGIAILLTKRYAPRINRWHPAFRWLCTFLFVSLTWVIFRADSIKQALRFYQHMFGLGTQAINRVVLRAFMLPEFSALFPRIPLVGMTMLNYITYIAFAFALHAVLNMKNTNERMLDFKPGIGKSVVAAGLLFWCVVSLSGVTTFLYWNF